VVCLRMVRGEGKTVKGFQLLLCILCVPVKSGLLYPD